MAHTEGLTTMNVTCTDFELHFFRLTIFEIRRILLRRQATSMAQAQGRAAADRGAVRSFR